MKKLILIGLLGLSTNAFAAETSIIEGKVVEVQPAKREIYVQAEDKKYEYYFNDKTTLTKDGQPVKFDELADGKKVRVTAQKYGKRYDPTAVEILD